jgi:hypothetical protein
MIKKPTLFILICAIMLGVAVYFFDWKRGQKEKPADDNTKPAFSLPAADIASLTVHRPAVAGEPAIRFERRGDHWEIVQPIETEADQPSSNGIIEGLATARIEGTEPGTPDRLKVYGLDPPEVSLEFQTKSGAKHTVELGKKDFTGISVYSIVDSAKDVVLLPESLLISADKSLQDLRDRTVLRIASPEVTSFTLKNPSGEIAAAKEKSEWRFTKPAGGRLDENSITSLLSVASSAKMTAIVKEKPENLARYGLSNPAIMFTAVNDQGKSAMLVLGKKEGDEYFARDPSRPMIFRINEELYKKLAESYGDLRDKALVHLDSADVNRIEIHNVNGTIICNRKSEAGWTFEEPRDQKGKNAASWKLFDPLTEARAEEIIDHPPAAVVAQLARPAFETILTGKDGKKFTVGVSRPSGDFVYAQTSGSPAIYKLKKKILDDLNYKATQVSF